MRATNRAYRLKNRARLQAKDREYEATHKESRRAAARIRSRARYLRNPEAWLDKNNQRRARMAGVPVGAVDRRQVFERDGWVCQICFDPVDPALSWPHPRSASLDHTIALYQGGPHSAANVRLSHLRCNIGRFQRERALAVDP